MASGTDGGGPARRRLAPRPLTQPAASRLPGHTARRDRILEAHAHALDAGETGYLDPETGLFVLTAAYLADRGSCCGRGCRHCPYLNEPTAADPDLAGPAPAG